jgi:formylglycine-generating enzyme required for sulfatase activity
MATIFLSYSRKDSKVMQRAKSRLEQAGVSVWTDEGLRPGTPDWQMAIEREIEACKGMVVLLSQASCQSVWVRREINRANRLGRLIIPIFIEMTSQSSIPILLENTQYIDASSNFDVGVSSLLDELDKQGWIDSEKELRSVHVSKSKLEESEANKKGDKIPELLGLFNLPQWVLYAGGGLALVIVLALACWGGNALLGYINGFETPEPLVTTSIAEAVTMTETLRPTMTKTMLLPTDTAIIEPTVTPSTTTAVTITNTPRPTSTKTVLLPTNTATIEPTITESPMPEVTYKLVTDDYGVSMALVPAGSFEMGSETGDSDEEPIHTVMLEDFYIDQYEVTNAQYAECVDTGVCDPPEINRSYKRPYYYGNTTYADYPVIRVSWYDAQTYCQWRDARLPTEAEWEKAARGGLEGKLYPWGDKSPICEIGFPNGAKFDDNKGCNDADTEKVGTYEPNGYGLYDMAGNVWEWTADWYDSAYYANSPIKNPVGPETGQSRVMRGGSCSYSSFSLRVYYRKYFSPTYSSFNIGFRCARDASP